MQRIIYQGNSKINDDPSYRVQQITALNAEDGRYKYNENEPLHKGVSQGI